MKKLILIGVLALSSCFAHELWVNVSQSNNIIKAQIGFGHGFPVSEAIDDKDLKFFAEGINIYGVNGKEALMPKGKNGQYESKDKVKDGSYVVSASFKNSWPHKDKPDICRSYAMFGKSIINVGKSNDESVFKKPIGQILEIIPIDNPMSAKANKPFKVKVLFDGKPLEYAQMTAVPAGFPEGHKGFMGDANEKGEISLTFLKEGLWMIEVMHDVDELLESTKCVKNGFASRLVINVK